MITGWLDPLDTAWLLPTQASAQAMPEMLSMFHGSTVFPYWICLWKFHDFPWVNMCILNTHTYVHIHTHLSLYIFIQAEHKWPRTLPLEETSIRMEITRASAPQKDLVHATHLAFAPERCRSNCFQEKLQTPGFADAFHPGELARPLGTFPVVISHS